jgi:2-desacetyl-2-hydroxyethyl bacteriochlorophyllide A dehydrogenase
MAEHRLVAFAPRSLELEPFPLPAEPPPGAMVVEAWTTAISAGTEVANYLGRTRQRSAEAPDWRANPYYPGYSLAGVVRAVGAGVAGFAPGDRVCGHGPHASAAVVDPGRFVTMPEGVAFDDAALTTLVCIAMNAVRLARIELGDRVAVVGAGLVGQLALQLAQLCGARPTVASEPIAARREVALRCGASAAVDPAAPEAARQFAELGEGQGFQVVFEATGSPAAFNPALKLAARGGRLILLGSTRGLVEQFDPYGDVHLTGVTMIGAHISTHPAHETPYNRWTIENNRRLALRLIGDGSLRLDPLISHRVAAEEAPALFDRLAHTPSEFLGALIRWRQ